MNILWDFRLFSYGYRDRGIGTWCRNVAASILKLRPDCRLFVWGDRSTIPAQLQANSIIWIPYRKGSWKSSILILPWLVLRHRIDLLHYWVTLGPLPSIGMTPFAPCPSIATVYDMGVELWGTPYGNHVRSTAYWSMQKRYFSSISGIIAISGATMEDLLRTVSPAAAIRDVVYMPLIDTSPQPPPATQRGAFFITLGGSTHKNCSSIVAAFSRVRSRHPAYRLIILGPIDPAEESLAMLPDGVTLVPSMERYEEYLRTCSGLLFCSLYEGLGIPPLEAMRRGCPLLLSAIAPLNETCSGAGRFVDPRSVDGIAEGIDALVTDTALWADRSLSGAKAYRMLSDDASDRCLRMYERLTGKTVSRQASDSLSPPGGRP
ncbi:MAG: glycosyltransferase [Chitinispirillaceae bacterium]|nr:glycosyltransferase [Chitinispirillaceae bacterium]